jgi:hypothetical protein
MIGVIILELVRNSQAQGSPISLKVFRAVFVKLRAFINDFDHFIACCQSYARSLIFRSYQPWSTLPGLYEACQRHTSNIFTTLYVIQDTPVLQGFPNETVLGLNNTANPPTILCTTEELCGFGGFHDKDPSQWFRSVINRSFLFVRDLPS